MTSSDWYHRLVCECRAIAGVLQMDFSGNLLLTVLLWKSFVNAVLEENERVYEYNSFDEYKKSLKRKYFRPFEEIRSRLAFEDNLKLIRKHNKLYDAGKATFRLRANCLADLNTRQYLKRHVRLVKSSRKHDANRTTDMVGAPHLMTDIPESLDWRDKGFVTKADNQGSCGSCYAFSISQSIEGQIYKRTGKILPLSEQQIVDCSVTTGNHGCAGGSLRNTLKYLERLGGLMRRQDYKYRAKQGKCQFVPELSVVNVTSWAILPSNDEDAMKVAVATIGPIAVSINASPQTFQLYSDGVYDDDQCSSNVVNHAMLLVGFGPDFWILKNWWGYNWGDNGYMKIKRGKNLCGIANYAAYAIV